MRCGSAPQPALATAANGVAIRLGAETGQPQTTPASGVSRLNLSASDDNAISYPYRRNWRVTGQCQQGDPATMQP